MPTADGHASDLIAIMHQVIAAHLVTQPRTYPGYIVPGSWKATAGTVRAQRAHLAAVQPENGDPALYDVDLPLLTSAYGHQYGPRGWESCILIPHNKSYAVLLTHDPKNSPQAASGEHHVAHYSKTGVIDAYMQFRNDAATGDGKASLIALAGALVSIATQGGQSLKIDDNANRVVVVSNLVELGADNLDATLDAVATVRFVRQYVDTVFNAHVHPGVQGGPSSTAPPSTTMQTSGSTTVRAKP